MHIRHHLTAAGLALLLSFLTVACTTTAPQPEPSRTGSSDLFNLDDADVKPRPVTRPAPVLPRELWTAGVKGDVVVEFIIGKNGEVVVAQIASSTDSRLNEAALAAVRTWRFIPAQKRGRVVNCRVSQRLTFESTPPPRTDPTAPAAGK